MRITIIELLKVENSICSSKLYLFLSFHNFLDYKKSSQQKRHTEIYIVLVLNNSLGFKHSNYEIKVMSIAFLLQKFLCFWFSKFLCFWFYKILSFFIMLHSIELKYGIYIICPHPTYCIDFGEIRISSFFTGVQKRILIHYN